MQINKLIPYRVKKENHRFYKITNVVYLIGLIGHINAIGLFIFLGINELIWFNSIFSVPVFISALVLNRMGHQNLAFGLAFFELLFHQLLATYFLGWEGGAQFWLIYLAALSFFNPRWGSRVHFVLLTLVVAGFVFLYFFAQSGVYEFDKKFLDIFYFLNSVTILGLVPILINYYSKSTYRAELQLTREKRITEKQNKQLVSQHNKLVKEQDKTHRLLNKIESLFGQQVSREVAQVMIESESEIDSMILDLSVMFLDIRDFTLFADSREPAEVARFQNIVFGELIEIVKNHKGIVSQILGDGIYAIFGAPVAFENHARNAVRAGLEMVNKIQELGESGKIPKIKIGIGINSGKVLAGNVGNETRKFYSLTGKNVIIGARIEQLNKQFNSQLLISEKTLNAIKKKTFDVTNLGAVSLKGIEKKVVVYKLK